MKYKTKGIVLKSTRYRDNDRIVQIYTQDFGKVSYLVHAPASKRSVCRTPYLQALSVLSLEVDHHDKRELQHIVETSPLELHPGILADPLKAAIAFFMADLAAAALYSADQDEDLFDFLEDYSLRLDRCEEGIELFPVNFAVALMGHIGFYPTDSPHNDFVGLLNQDDRLLFQTVCQNKLTAPQSAKALRLMLQYFRYHLASNFRSDSVEMLLEMLR
ncbi:MAG: DNA repair protein RecO [Paludibacteraceae bacterium]|nr:DNA repair protein RecO [Paludibacteraceae bacterium]